MSVPPTIRVLVVDDQPVVRSGLMAIIDSQADLEVVGEAGDGAGALEAVHLLDPDVVLMDIRMPGMDGIEATRAIVRRGVRARVLVMTTFDLDEHVHLALRAGAVGFLLKDATRQELVSAVRIVASGEAVLAPAVTKRLLDVFAGTERTVDHVGAERLQHLTEREREVLVLIGGGLTNAEIGERLTVGASTVKTHVNRIFAKLHLRDRVQAVILAYDCGLVGPGS